MQYLKYRAPMKFGGRVVTDVVLLDVEVEAETRDGRRGRGRGSMPMSGVWAWPSRQVPAEKAVAVMVDLGQQLVAAAAQYRDLGHPLEITHALAHRTRGWPTQAVARGRPGGSHAAARAARGRQPAGSGHPRRLRARPSGGTPTTCWGRSSSIATSARTWRREFAGEYLDRYTLRQPKPRMPLYHLVGALDPLTAADLAARIGDGLPETLPEWIAADGLTHLKIKLNGDDLAWDVDRVLAIERVAAEAQAARGCTAMVLFGRLQREVRQRRVRARFPGPGRRAVARGPGPLAVHRAAHAPRPAGQPREPHAPRGPDQAGRDRRIAGRPGKPAC